MFELPSVPTSSFVTSKTLRNYGTIDAVKWDPLNEDLLAIWDTQTSTLSIFDVSLSNSKIPIVSVSIESNPIDFDFLIDDRTYSNSWSFLCLNPSGSISILKVPLVSKLQRHYKRITQP